jgi:tRNA threonylcarbamoyl adenosine modification protein (Sua5/YciO/YrdC/YwlC family)
MNTYNPILHKILSGAVVILPTETVYGIACLPEHESKLNQVKQREYQPSAYIYPSVTSLFEDIPLSEYLKLIVERLLPGPFTLLLPQGSQKIGVRVPDHSLCVEFLSELGRPVVMTSANLHKQPPAISFAEAKHNFPDLDGLDGGQPHYSKPSAIIDLTTVLR